MKTKLHHYLICTCLGSLACAQFEPAASQQTAQVLSSPEFPTYHSQASQDKFVFTLLYEISGKQDQGYYLEIGAGDPIFGNNTYTLENQLAWHGVSIDIVDQFREKWLSARRNPLLIQDATHTNYAAMLQAFPRVIDYLSLDIDSHYDTVLNAIPFEAHVFKIITIEHDFYRYGDLYRISERLILSSLGYHLLCPDVADMGGIIFEDWWIHPSAFDPSVFSKLTLLDLKGKRHKDLIDIIQSSTCKK